MRQITRLMWPLVILFQAVTRLESIWMLRVSACFSHCSSCTNLGNSASMSVARVMWMYKGDMNLPSGENWMGPSTSTDVLFNGYGNEETLNVNKVIIENK